MSSIALTSATRANLLSLQNTSVLLDQTQLRLATGRKINSVFDDPINFVTAQRLDDRAQDLGRVLDGISASLRTIEAAGNAVEAVETLLNQAQSVLDVAKSEITESVRLEESSSAPAQINGTTDLTRTQDLTTIAGITDKSKIYIEVTDPKGTGYYFPVETHVTIATGDSLQDLVDKINALNTLPSAVGSPDPVITASINANGGLSIAAGAGRKFGFEIYNPETVYEVENFEEVDFMKKQALAEALGFMDVLVVRYHEGWFSLSTTIDPGPIIDSASLLLGGMIAPRGTLLNSLDGFSGINNNGDTLTLAVDMGRGGQRSSAAITLKGKTIEGLVNAINADSTLKPLIQATYNDITGKISLEAKDSSVKGIKFMPLMMSLSYMPFYFGLGLTSMSNVMLTFDMDSEYARFGSSSGKVLALETQYNGILTQIDALIADAGFNGVNLLRGDALTTFFNPTKTSSLILQGKDLTSTGLNLTAANFLVKDVFSYFEQQVSTAIKSVRGFGASLTYGLNTIKTRQTFTINTINVLSGASDDLTLANEEEEGAKLLTLQTRQTLGITSLSLAAKAQQAILRLF